MLQEIPVIPSGVEAEIARAASAVETALREAEAAAPGRKRDQTSFESPDDDDDPRVSARIVEIPPDSTLIGIEPSVYRQISDSINAGKRHIMLYGPPGTGKTSLAQHLAVVLHGGEPQMVTGSADWTSQDIVGGYQPIGSGNVAFSKGVLLDNFDKPLIVDELNRCDIDKVLGPLFTVLSNHATILPYRQKPEDPESERYVILPAHKANAASHEFAPTEDWRLIATINSIDKTSLYQMSYALTRRFAWILIDVPADIPGFIAEYCERLKWGTPRLEGGADLSTITIPIARVWQSVNEVRPMGPAPFVDLLAMCRQSDPEFDFFEEADYTHQGFYVAALSTFVVPMLDGILREEAHSLSTKLIASLNMDEKGKWAAELRTRVLGSAI
jgi:5-methylcytosine-specific restriction enzyme B